MTQPEETPVSFIPSNFIEKGKILNGTFDIRNAIESIVLSLAIGIPVFHLPLSLTARIIILCMTALPAAMVALIGIGGESITAFLMNALRFVVNRRVIWRSDSLPEGKPRRKPRFKEPKTKKHRKAEKMAEPSKVMASAPPQSEPDAPAPPKSKKKEHRQFDTSTKRGIKKQAKVLPNCGFVLSYNSTPTSKTTLPRALEKLANLAGVHRIKIHALRHSHASLLISMGENPLLIKERLGHEKIQTTLGTYGHLYPNTNIEIAKKLTGVLSYQSASQSIANYTSNQHTAMYHK